MTRKSSETEHDIDLVNQSNSLLKKTVLFFWHFHRKLTISLIILLASVLIILHSMAYYLEHNPQIIKDNIETYLQRSVSFEKIKVNIDLLFPSVSMQNFVIQNKTEETKKLKLSSANIKLNIPLSIVNGQAIIDTLSLEGVSALVVRNSKGNITIADRQVSREQKNTVYTEAKSFPLLKIFQQSNVVINNSEIVFVDKMMEYPDTSFTDVNFKMKNRDDRHQISFQASLNNTETNVDFRLDFQGKINELNNWNGKTYGAIENLNHQSILHFIKKDILQIEHFKINNIETSANVWSEIEGGKLQFIRGELSLKDAKLERIDRKQAIRFNHLETNFKLERLHKRHSDKTAGGSGWSIDLFDLSMEVDSKPMSQKHISLKYLNDKTIQFPQVEVFLNVLNLDEFSHVISFFSPEGFSQEILGRLKPKGRLNNIVSTLKLKSLDMPIDIIHYQVETEINNFSINSFQSLPKIRNLSARLQFNEAMGRVKLNGHGMELHLKSLFRDAWPVTQLSGDIYWQKDGRDWLFGAENLNVINPHLKASADLKLWFPETGQVFMDLTGFYHDANVQYVPYYLPVTTMSKGLVKWLDESIISGWGTDGGVVYRGNLSHFPYKNHDGKMDIVFNTSDVVLEYQKGWPKLTDIKAQVQFTEQGMIVDSHYAKTLSAVSNNISVDLPEYLAQILTIKGDINADVNDAHQFLKQSKMASDDLIATLDAKDNIGINLDITIPLKEKKPDSKVTVSFNDADYYPPGFERRKGFIEHLKGDVLIHNNLISAKRLTANIMGHHAKIAIKTEKQSRHSSKDPAMSIRIDTNVSVKNSAKFNFLPASLMPFKHQLTGKTKMRLDIELPNKQRMLAFNISSDLKGLSSKLPPPLAKQAKDSRTLNVSYSLMKKPAQTARLNIAYTNFLSSVFLFDTSTKQLELLKGNIAFESKKSSLPKQNTLKLSGSLTQVPFAQWQIFFASQSPEIVKKEVNKEALIPVELAIKKLILPALKKEPVQKTKANTIEKNEISSLKPEQFPLLNGTIESLQLGENSLGNFTIKSSRVAQGIVFDSLTLQGEFLTLEGKAKWHRLKKNPQVDLEAKVSIPSIEDLSNHIGYGELMRNGEFMVSAALNWAGSPVDFSKQGLQGDLSLSVKKGTYLEAQPGAAGRLLGLLNMNALARRITLDFSDVKDKGFKFDEIKGDFRFKEGNAHTDNLLIIAPSARILLTGRTGMVKQDFDQRVTVIPNVSATLPIAGAAVAGPAGAAVAWVGQKILGEQLNKITAYDYTVKGTWDEPVIERDKTSKKTLNNVKSLFHFEESTDDTNKVLDTDESEFP